MKRILAAGSIAALALVGVVGTSGTAHAAPAEAACFGQVHKFVNSGGLDGISNVGELVKAVGGGQAKNAAANGFC